MKNKWYMRHAACRQQTCRLIKQSNLPTVLPDDAAVGGGRCRDEPVGGGAATTEPITPSSPSRVAAPRHLDPTTLPIEKPALCTKPTGLSRSALWFGAA